ncbi:MULTISPECIES: phage tail tape measure protein [Aeromonas]|uniref:phage tail tape measure protein n=1 Tax=Aeromonas TaxID=642 RepID=UPI000CDCF1A3|nr:MULTISPECIES: phage tail tape measure protein [Aeromonas]AUZ76672.1 phage tail tape measure protein [Aeromonas sp. ASNIH4]POU40339.1 phage tail tape measure protein [Aeromonas hydrophila]POV89721.1 phage tail tape measure protein [Aeromonas sp. ASNIH6]
MAWMEKLMMQVALVDQVTKPLAGINAQMDKVSKAGRQGWGSMAMGATTVAGGVMAIQGALGPAIEMDRALAEVASLDVQKDVLGALGREALKLSIQYGESATEIVRSSYDIQSAIAGLEGNELPAFTRASTTLAKATKADTATITNYMGTMYGIFEQQAKQMGKANWVEDVAGKTALAVQLFKTTGQGMADAFGAIGANATAAGVSMDEQFAVIGQLQATMSGGEAGTKFKSFLAGVGGAQKALGMQFTDSAGNMLPVLTILDKLKMRYGETMSVAEGDELKKAFGSDEAVAMIKLLMTNTKGLATNINALANTHGMGKAEQMAASMTDQWERVTQGWFAIRAAAFGVVLPAINAVVGVFADGANDVLRWTHLFPNLTKVISYAALAFIGLGMVTGAWLLLVGMAQLAVVGLGIVFGALAWPILAVAAAIAALVMWWEPIKAFFSGLISAMAPAISTVFAPWAAILPVIWDGVSSLIGIIAQWLGTTNQASGAFTNMIALGEAAGTILGTVFKLLLSPIWAVGKAIQWVLEKLNVLPGVDLDISSSVPDLTMPTMQPLTIPVMPGVMSVPAQERQQETVNAPLARYRQQDQSKVPSGGIGQQLIQANAAATSANQKPAKSLHVGEVHITNQNPMTPEQMAENVWLETK